MFDQGKITRAETQGKQYKAGKANRAIGASWP